MPIAIVAIPEVDDFVWKISSEKVPHLTLLTLGESSAATDLNAMADFVSHVADTSMHPFGMSVDYRGPLGPNEADVLFFHDKNLVDNVRSYLLTNDAIRTAYDSSPQFPEFTPHLTLGFPATPAKVNPENHGIHWVSFDRIALWTGDFEGPEFRLKEQPWGEMWMGADLEDVLAHFGVRGMKWGVRRTPSQIHGGASEDHARATSAQARAKAHGKHTLSNAELKQIVERMNLEKQHSEVIKSRSKLRKGHEALKTTLAVAGTVSAAVALASSPAGKLVGKHLIPIVKTGVKAGTGFIK